MGLGVWEDPNSQPKLTLKVAATKRFAFTAKCKTFLQWQIFKTK